MPTFIDYHEKLPQMPPAAMEQVKANVKAHKTDQFGVKAVNLYMGAKGEAFCMTEAPNADAVIKSHKANGIDLKSSDIHQVQSLA